MKTMGVIWWNNSFENNWHFEGMANSYIFLICARPWCIGTSLEKEMATLSSILAWRTPWTKKPGRLESMGSQRVRQDLVTEQQLGAYSGLCKHPININISHRSPEISAQELSGNNRTSNSISILPTSLQSKIMPLSRSIRMCSLYNHCPQHSYL